MQLSTRVSDQFHRYISTVNSAVYELKPKPVRVGQTIDEALKFLRASIPTTINISQTVETDSKVMADPSQILQVIMNLCSNAAHAMRNKGGTLKISLADFEPDSDTIGLFGDAAAQKLMKLTVQDTGDGIPPEFNDRIFDPFFTTNPVMVAAFLLTDPFPRMALNLGFPASMPFPVVISLD